MTTIENEDVVVPDVSPNTYAETAQLRVEELRKWREQIPRFAIPETADARRKLATAASVSPEFIELTNVAVTNQTALVGRAARRARISLLTRSLPNMRLRIGCTS